MDTIKNIIKSIKKLERNDFSRTFKAGRHLFKVGVSPPKTFFFLFSMMKNDEKYFLFHVKSSLFTFLS